jgi:hypothetical protein
VEAVAVLNDYHIQFLQHLVRHDVSFLIVRGQARRFINSAHQTRDLDIWVSIADKDKPALERALIEWASKNPQHTNRNWASPLPLRPKVQIAFPENDGVWYMDRTGALQEISTVDRIDVLTSLVGMEFEECLKRAVAREIEGVTVHAMCAGDLDVAAEHRFESEGRY